MPSSGGRFRLARLGLAAGLLLAGCTKGGDEDRADTSRSADATTATTATTAEGAAGSPAADGDTRAPEPTTAADLLASATTEAPVPSRAFELSLSGAATGTASGDAATRCVRGAGYFDVIITPEPPLPVGGGFAVTSVTFGAPGFRGPGRYAAAEANDAEWSVGLVDTETGDPFEYYSPLEGASGSVTIEQDARSGRFEISGLVDDEGATLKAAGRFACGVVEG